MKAELPESRRVRARNLKGKPAARCVSDFEDGGTGEILQHFFHCLNGFGRRLDRVRTTLQISHTKPPFCNSEVRPVIGVLERPHLVVSALEIDTSHRVEYAASKMLTIL